MNDTPQQTSSFSLGTPAQDANIYKMTTDPTPTPPAEPDYEAIACAIDPDMSEWFVRLGHVPARIIQSFLEHPTLLAKTMAGLGYVSESENEEALKERDDTQDKLDEVVEAVSSCFKEDVGEWSSGNNPANNAIEILESHEGESAQLEQAEERVRVLEEALEGILPLAKERKEVISNFYEGQARSYGDSPTISQMKNIEPLETELQNASMAIHKAAAALAKGKEGV